MTHPGQNPLPLSVSIVCRDNETTIGRVVDSVRGFASEIIALDSGSRDRTVEILRQAGATVIDQPWLGFVRQKQAALDRCTQPWVLHLDSDESVQPELAASIRQAITRNDPAVAGYLVNRKVWYAGKFLEHAWQPEWRLRLIRRGWARWGGLDPHDALQILIPPGESRPILRTERLAGDLRHDSIASIAEFLEKQSRHARIAAESQLAEGRRGRVRSMVFSPVGEFMKQIVLRSAWRDGWRGWVAASASSVATAMKHAILVERSRSRPPADQNS